MKVRTRFYDGYLASHARAIVANLADNWGIPIELARQVAGVPAEGPVAQEALDRIMHLMSLQDELDDLFVADFARRWPLAPNCWPPFRGASPVEAMAWTGLEAILAARRQLELYKEF